MKYLILLLALSGCTNTDYVPPLSEIQRTKPEEMQFEENERVTVTRIGVVRDLLAYGDKRGIYIITDKKTGKEFIGVSGIGIAENGSHSSGKHSTTDER